MFLRICLATISILLGACQEMNRWGLLGPGTNSVIATASDSDDCGFVQNSYGQRVSWDTRLPISVAIDPSFPESYKVQLYEAAKIWDHAVGKKAFHFVEQTKISNTKPTRDLQNVIYYSKTWERDKSIQALTSLFWKTDRILEADLVINGSHYSYSEEAHSEETPYIHLQSLLIHELGHMLGLKHRRQLPTVMYEALYHGVTRTNLSSSDLSSIKCEYQ